MTKTSDDPTASPWSGFRNLDVSERRALLDTQFPGLERPPMGSAALPDELADVMVENYVGTLPVPIGLGLHMRVNDKAYSVPMAVEEPSVIAAVSGASKFIGEHGGFQAQSTPNLMIAQVQLLDFEDYAQLEQDLRANKFRILERGNEFCPRMVDRGGGCRDLQVRLLPVVEGVDPSPMAVVYITVDVCEAMGANVVNTIAEGISPLIASLTGARVGLRILSNLASFRRSRTEFRVPVEALAWKGRTGSEVAERILEAYAFAERDPYRAATHNKGIMNGIDAVALATGQDWRAIEAGAHAWAARGGRYRSLTRYRIEDGEFVGELELPLAPGTKGGALATHPTYQYAMGLLDHPDAQTLGQIMACIGLAQNFAALRALATEGISAGHMALHARNLAIAAGVPAEQVGAAVRFMRASSCISREGAMAFLEAQAPEGSTTKGPDGPSGPPHTLPRHAPFSLQR